jgi:hypothetical protein
MDRNDSSHPLNVLRAITARNVAAGGAIYETVATPFGTVSHDDYGTTIHASDSQLWDWSHRPGSAWPCSYLDDCEQVSATFDRRGDLVDIEHPGVEDIPCDEFNAWSSDVLRAANLPEHPAIRS